MIEKLKNCPCCGGKAEIKTGKHSTGDGFVRLNCISCIICGLNTGYHSVRKGSAKVIWNARYTNQIPKGV